MGTVSIGAFVREFVAECVLPTFVNEVGTAAACHAARHVARSVFDCDDSSAPRPATPLYAVPATTVLSQTPGRVRLKIMGLHGDYARARALAARLEALPGVQRASVNALTGNALVEYEPKRIDVAQIRAVLEPHRPQARRAGDHFRAGDSRQLALVGL